jgi:hypothetical protein
MTERTTDEQQLTARALRALALLHERTCIGTTTPPERVVCAVLTQQDGGADERHGPMMLNATAADELRKMIVAVVDIACDVLDNVDRQFHGQETKH